MYKEKEKSSAIMKPFVRCISRDLYINALINVVADLTQYAPRTAIPAMIQRFCYKY